jgi:hypothetical protein
MSSRELTEMEEDMVTEGTLPRDPVRSFLETVCPSSFLGMHCEVSGARISLQMQGLI